MTALVMIGLVCWLSRRRLSLAGELATAVSRRELAVHYQPIIDLRSPLRGAPRRWCAGNVPAASRCGRTCSSPSPRKTASCPRITAEVFRLVIRDMEELLAVDRGVHISVNLGASDMKDGEVLRVLERMLLHTSIEPRQIWLEATERGFMDVDTAGPVIAEAPAGPRRGHRRLWHGLFQPGLPAAPAARFVENRQDLRRCHRHRFGHPQGHRAHHRHGPLAQSADRGRRHRAPGPGRLPPRRAKSISARAGCTASCRRPSSSSTTCATWPARRRRNACRAKARRWPPEPAASRLRDVKAGVPQWRRLPGRPPRRPRKARSLGQNLLHFPRCLPDRRC